MVLPSAPHVPIQIAHLAGAGGFDDPSTNSALSLFIDAIARHDPRMANLYFDICGVAGIGQWKEKRGLIAERIRQIGISRIVWGSDGAFGAGMTPAQAMKAYQELPLTTEEFHRIAHESHSVHALPESITGLEAELRNLDENRYYSAPG